MKKYKFMYLIMKKYWYLYIVALFLFVIDGATTWFCPYNLRQILSFNISDGDMNGLKTNIILLIIVSIVGLINTLLLNYVFTLIGNKSVYDLQLQVINKCFEFNAIKIKESNGKLFGILYRDLNIIQGIMGQSTFILFEDILFLIVTISYLAFVNISFVIAIIAIYPIMIITVIVARKIIKKQNQRLARLYDKHIANLKEFISNLYELIAYKGNSFFVSRYKKNRDELLKLSIKSNLTSNVLSFIIGIFNCTAFIIYIIIGSNKVISGEMSIGDLSVFILYVNKLFSPIIRIVNFVASFQQVKVSIDRVSGILDSVK